MFKEKQKLFFFFRIIIVGGDFITFRYRYRKQIVLGAVILCIIVAIISFIIVNYEPKQAEQEIRPIISKKEESPEDKLKEVVKVDIKGEINKPGIYSLSSEARIIDVIEKAGGLTKNANTTVINLSKKVKDEMVIIVYSNNEVKNFEKTKEKEQQVQELCIQKDQTALKNDACIAENITVSSKISINKASLEQLQTLPGIGESKAKDIITYREKNGPFTKVEDITKVAGIGESVFAKIKDYITL